MNSDHFVSRARVLRLLAATSRGIATTSLAVLTTTSTLLAAEAPAQDTDAQSQDKASQPAATGAPKTHHWISMKLSSLPCPRRPQSWNPVSR